METAAGSSGSVIWSRGPPKDSTDNASSLDDEVDIDDEALIRAYEKSRKLALSKLQNVETPEAKRKPIKSALKNRSADYQKNSFVDDAGFVPSNINQSTCTSRWNVGDRCMAVYDEDGKLYEVEIVQISKSRQTCVVRYCGYDEEEEKVPNELLPLAQQSHGHPSYVCNQATPSYEQRTTSSNSGTAASGTSKCGSCGCLPGQSATLQTPQAYILPPPLSPSAMPLLQSPSGPSSSTLHCALMSWYMAGFHTGYHQAVMDLRTANEAKQGNLVTSIGASSGCCTGGGSANLQNAGQQNRNTTKKPSPV